MIELVVHNRQLYAIDFDKDVCCKAAAYSFESGCSALNLFKQEVIPISFTEVATIEDIVAAPRLHPFRVGHADEFQVVALSQLEVVRTHSFAENVFISSDPSQFELMKNPSSDENGKLTLSTDGRSYILWELVPTSSDRINYLESNSVLFVTESKESALRAFEEHKEMREEEDRAYEAL